MKTLDIVIPYVHKKAASDELKLALRSISKNFLSTHRVILVGDLPEWGSDLLKTSHIPVSLIEGMPYAHCYDVNNKIRHVLASPQVGDTFIYTYDDIVFLKPVKLSEIMRLKADSLIENEAYILDNSTGSRKWNNLLITTLKFLQSRNLPTYNFETHLPRYFRKSDLEKVFDFPEFSIDPFLFSTIYFNMFFKSKPVLVGSEKCNIKATIYKELPVKTIARMCEGIQFLNFNSKGYNPSMQRFLTGLFPDKSPFER
jgi:hypothetical protein